MGGDPYAVGGSTWMSVRDCETPAALRAAVITLFEIVICPSPPAASNAPATMSAHRASSSLAVSQVEKAVMTPEASSVAHEQADANVEVWVVSSPSLPASSLSALRVFVAKVRSLAGLAEDVPPPPPPPVEGVGLLLDAGHLGGDQAEVGHDLVEVPDLDGAVRREHLGEVPLEVGAAVGAVALPGAALARQRRGRGAEDALELGGDVEVELDVGHALQGTQVGRVDRHHGGRPFDDASRPRG